MRVVIADDAALFREGLARLLEGAGIAISAQVGDADELLARVRADPPDGRRGRHPDAAELHA